MVFMLLIKAWVSKIRDTSYLFIICIVIASLALPTLPTDDAADHFIIVYLFSFLNADF